MSSWDTTTDHLLAIATNDLDDGFPPRPTLVAYAGNDGLAVVGIRPFRAGELLRPLLELASLLLPLGADRFALAVPGRAWSLDDPIPPVVDEVDLRSTVLTILTIDGHQLRTPDLDGTLFPYERRRDRLVRFGEPVEVGWPKGPAVDSLHHLVSHRDGLISADDPALVVIQFARCVLKGHQVVLAPGVADHLEALTAAPG